LDESSPSSVAVFHVKEVARLNEELRQLRESVRRKRLEREAAKRAGKRIAVDLRPELLRLSRFIVDLDQFREKLKSSGFLRTDREVSEADTLRGILLEMKNHLVTEKRRLVEEAEVNEFHEQPGDEKEELRVLTKRPAKDTVMLEKEGEYLESPLAEMKEEARLKSIIAETQIAFSENDSARPRSPHGNRRASEGDTDVLAERTFRGIRSELQSERMELANLRKSIEKIRATNARERRTAERDRNAMLRKQIRLEREKRKVAQGRALLRLKGASRKVIHQTVPQARSKRAIMTRRRRAKEWVKKGNDRVILGVKLGKENYGIDAAQVREITPLREITPIPRLPSYVAGLMNVRGEGIPVIDLKKRFGLKQKNSSHRHVVIVKSANDLVGILVDSATGVISVSAAQIHHPSQVAGGIRVEYLRGICELDDKLMTYLDLQRLLRQAVPIDTRGRLRPLRSRKSNPSQLNREERKVMKAIPKSGRMMSIVRRRVGFSADKLGRIISSLRVKGLIEVRRVGNSRLIRRMTV
jgi:purine-binding chemotaxis protein CheW